MARAIIKWRTGAERNTKEEQTTIIFIDLLLFFDRKERKVREKTRKIYVAFNETLSVNKSLSIKESN